MKKNSPVAADTGLRKRSHRGFEGFCQFSPFAEIEEMVGGSGLGAENQEFSFSHVKFRTYIRLPSSVIE